MTTGPTAAGDLTERLRSTSTWTDDLLAEAGIPVAHVPLVSIGGGFGSFVLADRLRIYGVPPEQMRVVSPRPNAWDTYRRLATVSQIPDHERIRSDSASCPDNLWGYPSYAFTEAWQTKSLRRIWQVATEPILDDYFTPRAGQVYAATAKEAERIGWASMLQPGRARMVRRHAAGGYVVLVTPPDGWAQTKRVAYRCRWAHIAVGYPGVNFTPDLQDYRQRTGDFAHVVNAYEPHEHVYEQLRGRGGRVLVRGSGIVGSRILQRLLDEVERHGARIQVLHLFRTWRDGSTGPATFRREAKNGFQYQAFNYAKAAWGGQLKERLERLTGQERADFIKAMGGTNTPRRKEWDTQIERARASGAYRAAVGTVQSVERGQTGILTTIRTPDGSSAPLEADYIIDATGLVADLKQSQLLADLLEHAGAGRNPMGRLDVSNHFEITGTRSEPGRMYASGSITLGGPFAPVDSFLGLQYVAQQISDDLVRQGFAPKFGPGRSIAQWWRWVKGVAP
ncbi:hypothetical protein [Granulicoccus sp. GXG6511]|uniref:hypothetical protein n=1 Tax=Granulicoccus sp. GXG6511 TaxID=3381351 RepID=UPI003D7C460A